MSAERETGAPVDGLSWPPLLPGTLIRRYKRFLADVRMDDGAEVTAHCPNSGRMTACSEPGRPVWISRQDNPKRKLEYTWEIISMPDSLVGVNTMVPNRLVARAIRAGAVEALAGYEKVCTEVRLATGSRLDLLLTAVGLPDCYVEVKNCTLVRDGVAMFPDAPTTRGRKHVRELANLVAGGARCVSFHLVQRMDAVRFEPARHVDPEYAEGLREAAAAGVEVLAWDTVIDLHTIRLGRRLSCEV
ncbi:MAG: DNA/RNA nuclease SfsA [Desulfatibacillaceae bacterium]